LRESIGFPDVRFDYIHQIDRNTASLNWNANITKLGVERRSGTVQSPLIKQISFVFILKDGASTTTTTSGGNVVPDTNRCNAEDTIITGHLQSCSKYCQLVRT